MSYDTASSTDRSLESDAEFPVPRKEHPGEPLETTVEPCADGSKRCIFSPEDVDPVDASTHWLAIDDEVVVSLSRLR